MTLPSLTQLCSGKWRVIVGEDRMSKKKEMS